MKKSALLFLSLFFCLLLLLAPFVQAGSRHNPLIVLCWHSVAETVDGDATYSVSRKLFIEQLEYLKTHGFQPVSVQQIVDATQGKSVLPEKPVLLSFDDAYRSYNDFVFPILSRFGYPSMLAVVGSWIENGPPEGMPEPLMTWQQIAAVSRSPLVEIASHTFNLHRAIRYNPIGNVAAVVSVRQFKTAENRYETEGEYRENLSDDFSQQARLFEKRLNIAPRVTVWPYGRYNDTSIAVAREHHMCLSFNLNGGVADIDQPMRLNRILVENRPITDFVQQIEHPSPAPPAIRAMQVDLDLIYDPASPEQTDRNLGLLIERILSLGVNTVFLQAFQDLSGDGNIQRVYFHNRVLPVAADIFSHAVHQMAIRGISVYAWMPTLSIVFPNSAFNQKYRVREYADKQIRVSRSWYPRLTPFAEDVRQNVNTLYADLAAGSQISGVLFQDDAYLTDQEDMHPLALAAFGKSMDRAITVANLTADPELQARWVQFKTQGLIDFIAGLEASVRRFRPQARFARNLYANVLMNPVSQTWFAQNYADFLNAYDHVVIMAYPQMENANDPIRWLKNLVEKARSFPLAGEKTIFKLQTYDWSGKAWIQDKLLLKEMRAVLASGARHVAYYPDNLWENHPSTETMKLEMSTRRVPMVR